MMDVEDLSRARLGTVLSGKWRLDALVGIGGMAAVYAATHVRNGVRVAVKVLHPEVAQKPMAKRRFLREGYAANKVEHPGVVRVFDDSAEDEPVYLVMELLSGESLKDRWKASNRQMQLADVGPIVSSALEVLAAAHRVGVTHRDIKPDNVFLTTDGAVKLLDFGIAAVHEVQAAGQRATATGSAMGTPAFMSPEQAVGRWSEVDARSDVFSIGATAFILLTGKVLHEGRGPAELIVAAATRRARPIATLLPAIPAAIAAVVDRALAFDAAERYANASDMKLAWDAALGVSLRAPTMVMPAVGPRDDFGGPPSSRTVAAPTTVTVLAPPSATATRVADQSTAPMLAFRPPAPSFAPIERPDVRRPAAPGARSVWLHGLFGFGVGALLAACVIAVWTVARRPPSVAGSATGNQAASAPGLERAPSASTAATEGPR